MDTNIEKKIATITLLESIGIINKYDKEKIEKYLKGKASLKPASKNLTVNEDECVSRILLKPMIEDDGK